MRTKRLIWFLLVILLGLPGQAQAGPSPRLRASPSSAVVTTPLGVQLTVKRTWWSLGVADFEPHPGRLFLVVEVSMTSEKTLAYAPSRYMEVRGPEVEAPAVPLILKRNIGWGWLQPGQARLGVVFFEVNPDNGPFTLVVHDDLLHPWRAAQVPLPAPWPTPPFPEKGLP